MREWTQIGFSSIYFVLGKLEKMGFVAAGKPEGGRGRRVYSVSAAGGRALRRQTLAALETYRPVYSSVLLGMMHWPLLGRAEALGALEARGAAIAAERARLEGIQIESQPLPDFIEALFEFSLGQLEAEAGWLARTLDYMATKTWLE
jgi:DNA-binding PadR family transcriptional regulator